MAKKDKEFESIVQELTRQIYNDVITSVTSRCENRLSDYNDKLSVIRSVLMSISVTVLVNHAKIVKSLSNDFSKKRSLKELKDAIKEHWLKEVGEKF